MAFLSQYRCGVQSAQQNKNFICQVCLPIRKKDSNRIFRSMNFNCSHCLPPIQYRTAFTIDLHCLIDFQFYTYGRIAQIRRINILFVLLTAAIRVLSSTRLITLRMFPRF